MIFLSIQVLVIKFFAVQSIPTLVFVDILMIAYIVIWILKAEFSCKDEGSFRKLTLPVLYLFISVIVASVLYYLGGYGIIWTVSWLLLGSVPLMIALIYIINVLRKHKRFDSKFFETEYQEYKFKLFKTGVISLGIVWLIILSPLIHNGVIYLIIDNDVEIQNTVNDLIDESMDNTTKTITLLNWFDRGIGKEENMANPYYRTDNIIEPDNDILLSFIYGYICIFSKFPNFCARIGSSDSNLVFASRYGMCEEYSALFNTMAYYSGLDVRRARCVGEDHDWNEVNISGIWVIVDATAVRYENGNTGFNLSQEFMEHKVAGEWRDKKIYPKYGNVSRVIAEYPDGRSDEDITYRYSNNTVNITLRTVDSNNKSISNVKIMVYSLNSAKTFTYKRIILEKTTNQSGLCTITLGDGNYRFKAEKGDLKATKTFEFNKAKSNYSELIKLG